MTLMSAVTMLRTGFVVLAAASAASSQDASRPALATRPAPELRLELSTSTPNLMLGDWLKFSAVLVNEGREPVTVVLPGDGSYAGLRTPIFRWTPARMGSFVCTTISEIQPEEVVTLEPGKSVKVDRWLGQPALDHADRHAVFVELENVPDLKWGGHPLSEYGAGTMELVRKSQPFKVKSNVVIVEVREHHPELAGITVAKKDLEEQGMLDDKTIRELQREKSDLSKPHAIEHHFICRDQAIADEVTKWGAEQGFAVSRLTPRKWKGEEALSFDLVQNLVPRTTNVTPETTAMLKIARKSGAHYDGWSAAIVKLK